MKNLLPVGIILIFIGIILIMISSFQAQKANVKGAGVVFLGPIPILGFGNDKKLIYILFGLGMLIFIIFEILKKIKLE
ncbi:DUF131 domain-containing protein [Candidatus Woesearchaeota archaeon]|nr:DUF131 domain-containing protein [Candidatus Woesearchaeota archaeon]